MYICIIFVMSVLQNKEKIEHEGVISKITSDSVYVKIIQSTACSDCHAKSACSISGSKEKTIEIPNKTNEYEIGDKVIISGDSSIGLLAVFYAFTIPLILIITALVIISNTIDSETFAVLFTLILLIVYFFILYLLRERLKNKLVFTLKKKYN